MDYDNYAKCAPAKITDFQSPEVTLTKAKYGWNISVSKVPHSFAKFKTNEKTGKVSWSYYPEDLTWWRPTKKWAKSSAEKVFLKQAHKVMNDINNLLQEETYTLDLSTPKEDYR